ncbi:MAG: hypothetical protein AAGA06_06230 [Pseudomonadota bacterium]
MKTNVIGRLYKDEGSARGMRDRLYRAGFARHTLSLVTPQDAEGVDGLQAKIEEAWVPAGPAKHYAAKLAEGACLVVVRATYKPLNAVRIATQAFETSGAIPSGLNTDHFPINTPPDPTPSILKDHPRFLTMPPSPDDDRRLVSERLGFSTLSPPKRRDSVMSTPKRFFGEGISRKARKTSTLPSGTFMSQKFWPQPLLSKRKRSLSVIPGGGHPFSRLLGWPTTSLIGR